MQLPSTYSSTKPYPVVFQFHPRGGSAEQALNEYRISTGLPDAIYVTPQGLTDSNGNAGWANTNGVDITFTKAMLSSVQSTYCVDNTRIFSVGFSYGGMMSFAVGCEMSDVFRAIAPMSGSLYSDFSCKRHRSSDRHVGIARSERHHRSDRGRPCRPRQDPATESLRHDHRPQRHRRIMRRLSRVRRRLPGDLVRVQRDPHAAELRHLRHHGFLQVILVAVQNTDHEPVEAILRRYGST